MNSINIRGKEYFPVNERVKSFRENFKDWAITTEIVSLTEETVVIKASVSNPDGLVKATGYAHYGKEPYCHGSVDKGSGP